MKKFYFLSLLTAYCLMQTVSAQQIISIDLIRSFSTQQIDSTFSANGIPSLVVPITYPVDVYKVTYNTPSYDGVTPTFATGALLVPQGAPCKMPLISYQHGTTTHRHGVSSYLSGEVVIGLAEATDGYTVAMPDYLGLGDGPGVHPYIHAASEATASLDMLRATREAQDSLGFELNGQLFLVGYSQGGHATMALHRLIETDFSDEFTVTASAPMSGPYDVSGVQAAVIVNDSVYSQPGYLPYILNSYRTVYNIAADWSDVLLSPYDQTLPPLLDGYHGMGDLNAAMPSIPNQILIPAVLDSFINDENHYFRVALRDNDVYDWTPTSPMRLYYCEADDEVYYLNAIVAYDKFIENGSTSVTKQSVGENYGHFECAFFALSAGKNWFDTFRNDGIDVFITGHGSDCDPCGIVSIDSITGGFPPYNIQWRIDSLLMQSTPPFIFPETVDSTSYFLNGVSWGYYTVTVTDSLGCTASGSVFVDIEGGINSIIKPNFLVFPNPFSETTTLQFEEAPKSARLEILDLSGKLLRSENVSEKKQIEIERKNLSSGTYLLTVSDREKGTSVAKLIIN